MLPKLYIRQDVNYNDRKCRVLRSTCSRSVCSFVDFSHFNVVRVVGVDCRFIRITFDVLLMYRWWTWLMNIYIIIVRKCTVQNYVYGRDFLLALFVGNSNVTKVLITINNKGEDNKFRELRFTSLTFFTFCFIEFFHWIMLSTWQCWLLNLSLPIIYIMKF